MLSIVSGGDSVDVGMVPASLCCAGVDPRKRPSVPLPVSVSASFNSVAKGVVVVVAAAVMVVVAICFFTEDDDAAAAAAAAGRKRAVPPTLKRFFLCGVIESEAPVVEEPGAKERRFAGEAAMVVRRLGRGWRREEASMTVVGVIDLRRPLALPLPLPLPLLPPPVVADP